MADASELEAAVLAATAGTLVTTLHQLGLRQEFERSADSWLSGLERAPWGGLIIALAPLPAVWEFVRFHFLGSDNAVSSPCFATFSMSAFDFVTRYQGFIERDTAIYHQPLPIVAIEIEIHPNLSGPS